ncbi:MAG: SoxR reducing system RseC family protein [Proteobacteria bacterium]|nr:SoxR reducing system RseC family protein [Pseudomonadota bacterium]
MLLETAHVVAVEADSVWVETIRKSTCGSCAAQKGCGHGILNKISSGRRSYIEVFSGTLAASHCAVDDHVRISIPEKVLLRGSMIVYMLPLVSMLLGASFAANTVQGDQDLLAIFGAAAGFALGVGLVRWHAWHTRSDKSIQPRLEEMVSSSAEAVTVR